MIGGGRLGEPGREVKLAFGERERFGRISKYSTRSGFNPKQVAQPAPPIRECRAVARAVGDGCALDRAVVIPYDVEGDRVSERRTRRQQVAPNLRGTPNGRRDVDPKLPSCISLEREIAACNFLSAEAPPTRSVLK